jgi:hypothetical protein
MFETLAGISIETCPFGIEVSMVTNMEQRAPAVSVEALIVRLVGAVDRCEIESVADALGASRDHRAIRPLLMRIGDFQGSENTYAEAAMCRALMKLGVMCRCGNCAFSLRPRAALPDDVVETIHELAGSIPWPYFGTRRI